LRLTGCIADEKTNAAAHGSEAGSAAEAADLGRRLAERARR